MNMDKVSKWMALLAILVLVVGCVINSANEDDRRAFLIECQNDAFKHYQCEALWRGSYAILDIPAVRNGLQ